MTTYSFGDVILVPFPFTDGTTRKKRPTIVISSDRYNQQRRDLILIAVTSQVPDVLQLGESRILNWSDAGLIKPSILKPIITTIEKNLVIRKLGTLDDVDKDAVRIILQEIIEISP